MESDRLALPPVPAPAPDSHPVRDRVLVALFALALVVPLGGLLMKPGERTIPFENRNAEPWPTLSPTPSMRDVVSGFERAFADRFGGRDALIRLYRDASLLVFHRSPAPKVLIGRNGWLYFTGEDMRALDRHYRGTEPFADTEIDALVRELVRRQAFLAAHGIAYVVAIVPDKQTIYPEHLPPWVRRAPRTPLDRAIDALERDGRVRIVDLRPPLIAAKPRDRVYFKTDSHWNVLGARVGYEAIMREVNEALAPDKRIPVLPPPRPAYTPGVDVYSGDLAEMLGRPRRYREDDLAPLGKLLADMPPKCSRHADRAAGAVPRETFICGGEGRLTLLMQRDSMGIPLVPLLAPNFRRSVFLVERRLDPAVVLAERPDVVIEEMVERTMHVPAALPMP